MKVKEKLASFKDNTKGSVDAMATFIVGGVIAFVITAIIYYLLPTILGGVTTSTPALTGTWGTQQNTSATNIQNASSMVGVVLIIEVIVLIIGTLMFLTHKK